MVKYQVKKYFEWGSLKLEPLQYLIVEQSDIENSYLVRQEKTKKFIVVHKKAFKIQLELGNIVKA